MDDLTAQLKLNETHQSADLESKIAERKRRKQLALRQDFENKRIQELKVGDATQGSPAKKFIIC